MLTYYLIETKKKQTMTLVTFNKLLSCYQLQTFKMSQHSFSVLPGTKKRAAPVLYYLFGNLADLQEQDEQF